MQFPVNHSTRFTGNPARFVPIAPRAGAVGIPLWPRALGVMARLVWLERRAARGREGRVDL